MVWPSTYGMRNPPGMAGPISRPETLRRQAEVFTAPSDQRGAGCVLIGWTLTMDGVGGRIVETEAYHSDRPGPRTASPGPDAAQRGDVRPRRGGLCLPVLRDSLVHEPGLRRWSRQRGAAPRPRAHGRPRSDDRAAWRGRSPLAHSRGRAACVQALGVTHDHNGLAVTEPPFALEPGAPAEGRRRARIGISKAAEVPWRLARRESRYLQPAVPESLSACPCA